MSVFILNNYQYSVQTKTEFFQNTKRLFYISDKKNLAIDILLFTSCIQKQSSRGVLKKRCSENMQHSNFIEITLRHGCSPVNFLHIFIGVSSFSTFSIQYKKQKESCQPFLLIKKKSLVCKLLGAGGHGSPWPNQCRGPCNKLRRKYCEIFKNSYFHKTPPVAASEKFINFPGKEQWRRRDRFIVLINTTEEDSMLISYRQQFTFHIFILT